MKKIIRVPIEYSMTRIGVKKNTEVIVVKIMGNEVELPITKKMSKDNYDNNKVKITIELT